MPRLLTTHREDWAFIRPAAERDQDGCHLRPENHREAREGLDACQANEFAFVEAMMEAAKRLLLAKEERQR